eukprot:TRINITY_DN40940_c0_g1_i1.p1 TRINITY_DN40940_c0_g1~~TRINITY_DN40940_c0_g1_i1.p1  ORF type:complete len:611 (+),score=90.49 TRINITY_DN40940_c0_g1_i1:86-1918(+)
MEGVADRYAAMDLASVCCILHTLAQSGSLKTSSIEEEDVLLVRTRLASLLRQEFMHGSQADASAGALSRSLSLIAWSHVKLALFDALGQECMQLTCDLVCSRMQFLQPRDLCAVLCAFAKFDVTQREALFDTFRQVSQFRLHSFTSEMLSDVMWAFTTAYPKEHGVFLEDVFNTYSKDLQSRPRLSDVSITEIGRLLHGVAKSATRREYLDITPVIYAASQLVPMFEPNKLAATCWSISSLDIIDYDVFERVCGLLESSSRFAAMLTAHGVTKLLWSFARQIELGSRIVASLQRAPALLAPALVQMAPVLHSPDLEHVLWSLIQLGIRSGTDAKLDSFFIAVTQMDVDRCSCETLAALSIYCKGFDTHSVHVCTEFQHYVFQWYAYMLEGARSVESNFYASKCMPLITTQRQCSKSRVADWNYSGSTWSGQYEAVNGALNSNIGCTYSHHQHTPLVADDQNPLQMCDVNGTMTSVEHMPISDFLSRVKDQPDSAHAKPDLKKMAAPRGARRLQQAKRIEPSLIGFAGVPQPRMKNMDAFDMSMKEVPMQQSKVCSASDGTAYDQDSWSMSSREQSSWSSSEGLSAACADAPSPRKGLACMLSHYPLPADS